MIEEMEEKPTAEGGEPNTVEADHEETTAVEAVTSAIDAVEDAVAEAEDVPPEQPEEEVEIADPMEQLREEIAELKSANEAFNLRLLRAQADKENFKKRSEKDRLAAIKYANKQVLLQVLDVVDNFDRAFMVEVDPKDNFVIGVKMIHKQLGDFLLQNGVEEISGQGEAFDPYLHEAIAREETSEFEENTVMAILQKGYKFKGQLLRPARVKVALPPSEEEDAAGENETSNEES